MTIAESPTATGVGLDPTWWVRGLDLTGRAGADAPARAEPDGGLPGRRLARWRALHGTGTDWFAVRLADAGLDEAGLLALLAEAPDDLAARRTRPAWAAFVESAVAAADEPAIGSGLTWLDGFGTVLAPFVRAATDRYTDGLPDVAADRAALRDGFADRLRPDLVRLAARTLVLELNVRRVTGTLYGDTPPERFASFVRHYAAPAGLCALLSEYPVLGRLIGQACTDAVDAELELLRRLAADRADLVATLFGGVDPGRLVVVEPRGDRHRGGRTVAILHFEGGARAVYKPRPVTAHVRFNDIVRWLNGKVPGLGLRTVVLVPRDGYGWAGFVEQHGCRTVGEVAAYFGRIGALAALLYAIDATDMHCENVIACGDQPVLVDVETLLHPVKPRQGISATDPAADALAASVYRIALLPTLILGEAAALDLSALGGEPGALRPDPQVDWDAPGTDEMRLVRRPVAFDGHRNRPRIGTEDADPTGYVDVLLSGFRTAYDAIVAYREELVGLLHDCADAEVRVLVRNTRLYTRLLTECTHPDVLRDALDRDCVLDHLWRSADRHAVRRHLCAAELADIWAGDVPLFVTRPGSRDMWTSTGRLPDVLPERGLDRTVAKVRRMGELDRYDQEWIVRACLATAGHPEPHPETSGAAVGTAPAAVPDPHALLAAAGAVADRIVGRAFCDGPRTNWIGLEAVDGRYWTLRPLGAGLASGYTGVALFLAQLAALTGLGRYEEQARQALRPIPALLADLAGHPDQAAMVGPGGFEGLGGVAYALARLAVLLGDAEVLGWVEPAVELTGAALGASGPGLLTGDAGAVAAMLAVHRATGLAAAYETARRAADRLLTAHPGGDPGFADGYAGVVWALNRFGHPVPVPATAASARRGWCEGTAGLALAGTPGAVDALLRAVPLANHSLCHGELGVLGALAVAASGGHAGAAAALPARTAHLLGAVETHGPRCGTPGGVDSPGLLTGLAGIGYGLLRLGFPDRVPSVLLLDVAPAPIRQPQGGGSQP